MNKRTRITAGLTLAATAALALSGRAMADHDERYRSSSSRYDYARVVDVKPLIRSYRVEIPVRECYETPRDYDRRPHRSRRGGDAGRTIAGAIIGGVIGRQFGDGSGRDAMTALGAVVGASAANDRGRARGRYDDEPVRYCETRYEYEERDRVEGFRVTYVYDGETYTTRTDYDPGDRIRVEVKVRPVTR
jgi:uncharacterized protein YcfJ